MKTRSKDQGGKSKKQLYKEEFRKLSEEIKQVTGWEHKMLFEKLSIKPSRGKNIMSGQSTPDGLELEALKKIHARVTNPDFRNLTSEQYEDLLDEKDAALLAKEQELQVKELELQRRLEELKRLEKRLETAQKIALEAIKKLDPT